jgi:hypothetical protein
MLALPSIVENSGENRSASGISMAKVLPRSWFNSITPIERPEEAGDF